MKKLITLLLTIGAAIAVVVFFRRKNKQSWDETWSSAKDTTSSWAKSAGDEAGKAADRLSGVAGRAGDAAADAAEEAREAVDG